MALNKWWADDPDERYWLEITQRPDIGTDLNAPAHNEVGKVQWDYELVRHVRPGDRIYHYQQKVGIVGTSVVSGEPFEDRVHWKSHTSTGEAYERDGLRAPLGQFQPIDPPVGLDDLRSHGQAIRAVLQGLRATHSGSIYFPFEVSDRRPLRATQGYLTKLPKAVVQALPALAIDGLATRPIARLAAYRPADEEAKTTGSDPFSRDPNAVDRATRSHARLQNAVAAAFRDVGMAALSPQPGEPDFDVAGSNDDVVIVVEVKSCTDQNARKQFRLALGQVLDYAHHLRSDRRVAPMVILESESPQSWQELCQGVGVVLTSPARLEQDLRRILDGALTGRRRGLESAT